LAVRACGDGHKPCEQPKRSVTLATRKQKGAKRMPVSGASEGSGRPGRGVFFLLSLIMFVLAESLTIGLVLMLAKRRGSLDLDISLYVLPFIMPVPLGYAFQAYGQFVKPQTDVAETGQITAALWRSLTLVLMFAYILVVGVIATVLPYLLSVKAR
jgi:hypothetical protein